MVIIMKVEYGRSSDEKDVSNMLVTFEEQDEWYSFVYNDSWIAKAVRAHINPRRLLWGQHVRDVRPITAKDLNEEELMVFNKIKAILLDTFSKVTI